MCAFLCVRQESSLQFVYFSPFGDSLPVPRCSREFRRGNVLYSSGSHLAAPFVPGYPFAETCTFSHRAFSLLHLFNCVPSPCVADRYFTVESRRVVVPGVIPCDRSRLVLDLPFDSRRVVVPGVIPCVRPWLALDLPFDSHRVVGPGVKPCDRSRRVLDLSLVSSRVDDSHPVFHGRSAHPCGRGA